MSEAYIIDIVRTPIVRVKRDGSQYTSVHPADLMAVPLRALVERNGFDPALVDDVIGGCVTQIGRQSNNITRSAVLAAGFPESVPATTVDRQCGSSMQAVAFGAQGIQAGAYDLVIAAGVESMSTTAMFSNKNGEDPFGPTVAERYTGGGLVEQGISAELIAARWGLSRADMDAYSLQSHQRAAAAQSAGTLAKQIVPVTLPDGTVVTADDGIRADSSLEALAGLKPAFVNEDAVARFSEIDWSVTAGNASQISDGASAILIASAETVERLGLKPRARIVASAVIGDDPVEMLSAVIPVTAKALAKAGLTIDDIDAFEVNEAFAAPVLAWLKDTGADVAKVNQNGGAIALGHPLGASGGRLLASLLTTLEETGGRYGFQTMCEAGGLANALIIERL
ncbi:MAG: thiolase family protein [Candidatus Nanopelagicales bacterium]|nr:thiolase family protein [Candidatus Nanopelagicales bacterium]